jgi:hypothetical protein
MRSLSLQALLAVACWALATVASTPPPLSNELHRDDPLMAIAKAELLAWKESAAGQTAIEHGYTAPLPKPASRAAIENDDRELQRFLDAKRVVEQLQRTQPDGVFSMATPFALLTNAEFVESVASQRDATPSAGRKRKHRSPSSSSLSRETA